MKKIIVSLLALIMLAMPVLAVDAGGNLGKVPYTLDEIKLDGAKDDVYALGLVVKAETTINEEVTSKGTAYLLYDEEYLYAYVEVAGDTWHPATSADKLVASPWNFDNVELLIDVKNAGNKADVHQYRIDAATGSLSGQIGNPASQTTNGTDKVKAAKYFEGALGKLDGGYAVEYKIPLTAEKVGLNIMVSDTPKEGASASNMYVKTQVASAKTGAPGAWKPEEYPYITLDGDEVTAVKEEAKAPATSAATFDGLAVLAVVAALSGAGVVVCKKK